MRGSALLTEKTLLLIILLLFFSVATIAVGTTQTIPTITQTNSTITVYLDPPSITGVTINETFTINITIRDALEIRAWQTGLIFNATALNCTGFFQGEFLKSVGTTSWYPGSIDNEAGVIEPYGCTFLGDYNANGTGQLAYVTFKVKTPGISDIHLRDIKVTGRIDSIPYIVPINIVDVYTVVLNATPHKVVTVSNSYGATGVPEYHSGFYDHAFSIPDREIRFKATNPINTPPISRFSNVTIPETLVSVESPDKWKVLVDGAPVSRTVTYNGTHYFIHFTYSEGVHTVQITSKIDLAVSLDAPTVLLFDESTVLNATVYNIGVNEEANVTLQLLVNDSIVNSTVISVLQAGQNSTISYLWTPPPVEATYNVTAYAQPVTDETVVDNNVETKFVTVRSLVVTPESGPTGTKVIVDGVKFGNQTQVSVTFNDLLIGYVRTDENGTFTFTFNIPLSAAGAQTIKTFDAEDHQGVATFTVIDVTPLDIRVDVGTIHFRGELATFYIQTAFKGTAMNATSLDATLYDPENEIVRYLFPENITLVATGFYRITYPILGDAPNGTHVLVAEADYFTDTVQAHGTGFKTFLLSPTLTAFNATLISLNGTVAWVQTEIGAIETDIVNIGLRVTDIDGNIATIQTSLGTIDGNITAIQGNMATIQTDMGTVQADISSVRGTQEAFTTPLYAAVALALIAAAGTIVTILLHRKPKA